MNLWIVTIGVLMVRGNAAAKTMIWQPAAGHAQIPIWPRVAPDAQPVPGSESMTTPAAHLVAGKPWSAVTNVTGPTMTV